jgi:hypothetical protein
MLGHSRPIGQRRHIRTVAVPGRVKKVVDCCKGERRPFVQHDLRRTCARLCHVAGGELEQFQFLLGRERDSSGARIAQLPDRG